MLQADQTPKLKLYDLLVIIPFAWVISQSILTGSWMWLIVAYAFFLNYAYGRREYV